MINEDLKNSGKCTDRIVILHTGLLIRLWKVFIVFLKFISAFRYSYFAGYRVSSYLSFWELNIMEILFLIDFILNFLVTYKSKSLDLMPVTDLSKIANNYY
jgi:hypothetical protein